LKNLGNLMKQAQQMQAKMAEMQERLGTIEVTGAAGGGMVQATLNGKNELRRIKIDPTLADPKEIEVLEDLIVAAVNDARGKVDAATAEEMRQLTGGLQLPPGMKLPF
jgi:DNA-binding YbaB/EbfC family protein